MLKFKSSFSRYLLILLITLPVSFPAWGNPLGDLLYQSYGQSTLSSLSLVAKHDADLSQIVSDLGSDVSSIQDHNRSTLLHHACFAGHYQDGLEAKKRKDYDSAFKSFTEAAREKDLQGMFELLCLFGEEKISKDLFSPELTSLYKEAEKIGDPLAQNNWGFVHKMGLGRPVDYDEARRLYGLAVEQGNPFAQINLGFMHQNGLGGPVDYVEARRLYGLATEQGHSAAQARLADLHKAGLGGPIDYVEARRLYGLAAEQGHSQAQRDLAYLHEAGLGGPVDHVEARRLYGLAAEQGDAIAQNNLANLLKEGRGGPIDYVESDRLMRLSAQQGNLIAQNNLKLLSTFYRENGILMKNMQVTQEDFCAICVDKFIGGKGRLTLLPCSHIFHTQCLEKWEREKEHPSCPECRANMLK